MPADADVTLTIESIITKGRFSTSTDFSAFVEEYAKTTNIGYLESMIEVCEQNDWDAASLAKSITPTLKAKMQGEANRLHLLKPKKTRRTNA